MSGAPGVQTRDANLGTHDEDSTPAKEAVMGHPRGWDTSIYSVKLSMHSVLLW
jgi:hypothetical protein